ncbi:MAG: carboxypeptidase regulatory-like domain-containing protein, partial [Holophagae bacterium]|nr:carboxypeptidase regulatory-like domain-containing protein [Holophagae bacterium]
MVESGYCWRCFSRMATGFVVWLLVLGIAGRASAGNITGTVKDAVTGTELSGVTVKVTQNTSKKATTNASGAYTISSVAAGTYTLTATKTNYVDAVTSSITVPASGTVTVPLIQLQPMGLITGTVVSSVGGAPVSSATVKITGTSTSATTATNGTFTLYAATGSYTLTITKTGWVATTTSSFSVTNGQTTALGSIPFVQSGTLTGTVVNSLNGAAVASARVTVTGTSTYNNTNTNGVFTLTTGAGPVTLTVTKSGWLTTVTGTITVVGGSTTTVPNIELTQLATVTGTVKEQGTNINLQGVTVTLQSDPSKTTTTGSKGTFSLASVPMGSQTLSLAKTGYQSRTAGPYTVNTSSFSVGTILLTKTAGTIVGTVRDGGAASSPLSGVTVSVNGVAPAITGTTAANGTFTLTGVSPGNQTVHAARDGWTAADSGVVTVEVGQTSSIGDLVLARLGVTINGVVRSTLDSSPVEGATVSVDEQPTRTTTTAADGTYTLSDVAWGLIHLTVAHPSYTGQTRELDLGTDGANEEFDLEIGRGTVAGEVHDAVTGLPLSAVWVRPEDQPDFNTGTDWQGHFELHDLPVGTYRMLFSRGDYTDADVAAVVVQTGQTTIVPAIDLQPRPGTIFGTALNPDLNQPLEGVTVVLARSGRTATTDGDGHYSFDNVMPGWEMVAFHKDGYISFTTDVVTVANNEIREIWGDLRPVWGGPIMLRLNGVVRDGTGAAIEGAEVTVAGGLSTTTAADGSYSLNLPRGTVVLRASKEGFQFALSPRLGTGCFYFHSDCRDIADFMLAATGDTGTVAATTTDPVTRVPRQGALAIWAPTAFVPVETAPDGTHLLTGIPPGRLFGWASPRTLLPGQTIALDFHGPVTIPEEEPRWAAAGIVTLATTGEPVIGARVTLSNPDEDFVEDTYTDEAGRWSFANGPEGYYQVEAWADGGLHTEHPWEFDAANDEGLRIGDLTLVSEADNGSLTILSPTTGQVLGSSTVTVQCEADLPVADAYVTAVAVELTDAPTVIQQVTYDPDGRHFQITFETSAANGPHMLHVWALTVRGPVLEASAEIVVQIGPQLAAIMGTVRDGGADDAPLPDVTVSVKGLTPPITATTNSYGRFWLAGVTPGTHTVRAARDGWVPADGAAVTVVEGQVSSIADIVLGRAGVGTGAVSGRVGIGPTGEGASRIWVCLESDPDFGTDTDWDGSFTLEGVPNGVHRLVMSRSDAFPLTTDEVEVRVGETTTLPPVLLEQRPARLWGWVQNPNIGQRLEGVTVMTARAGLTTTTDADGFFEFNELPPGVEVLTFAKEGYPPVATEYLQLGPNEEVRSDADMRPHEGRSPVGVLRGIVRDSVGLPVSGAIVTVRGHGATTTTSEGWFEFPIARGDYALFVEAPGYRSQVVTGLGGGHWYEWAWQARQDVVLAGVGETATVEITTTDPVSGAPRQGEFWLATTSTFYRLNSAPTGLRTLNGVEPGPALGWARPHFAPPGGMLRLDYNAPRTTPQPPSWAAGGFVVRAGTLTPVEGAEVTFTNADAAFSQTVLTNQHGRYRIASAPTGDYVVTVNAPGALHDSGSWAFSVADDGSLHLHDFELVADADLGSISVLSPTSGAIVPVPHVVVSGLAEFALADDYVRSVHAGLDPGWGGPRQVTLDPDGRHFSVEFDTDTQTGPATLWVEIQPTRGNTHRITLPVAAERQATITGLNVIPEVVLPGQTAVGWVTVNPAAPASGMTVVLSSSNPALAAVPPSVTLTSGSTSTSFPITAGATATPTDVEITASAGGIVKSAGILVDSFHVVGLQLASSEIMGGLATTGTVTLNAPAPAGGVEVALHSALPAVAAVPSAVTVQPGSSSASFAVGTTAVANPTPVEISASGGGSTSTAMLTVGPLAVASVAISPATIAAGSSAILTIALLGPAPPGGFAVSLSSTAPQIVVVPETVIVQEGNTQATVQIATVYGQPTGMAEISASGGGATRTTTLTVEAIGPIQLRFRDNPMPGGFPVKGYVTLNAPAPDGGLEVTLTSTNPALVSVPPLLLVTAGATTASFTAQTTPISQSVAILIKAASPGKSVSVPLDLFPVTVARLTVGSRLAAGFIHTARLELTFPATAGGLVVQLSSSNPALVSIDPTVTVPEGTREITLPITVAAGTEGTAVLSATLNGTSKSDTVTTAIPRITSLSFSPATIGGGSRASVGIQIWPPIPNPGLAVQLSTDRPDLIALPPSTVVRGWLHHEQWPTSWVAGPTTLQVTASVNGSSATASLTLERARLQSLTLNPEAWPGGHYYLLSNKVTLFGGAPPGGALVALTSTSPHVTVDPTVVIPAGGEQASFTISLYTTTCEPEPAQITATYDGVSLTQPFTLLPSEVDEVRVLTPSVAAGERGRVRIDFWGHPDSNCNFTASVDDPTRGIAFQTLEGCGPGGDVFHCIAYVQTYASASEGPLTVTYTMNGTSARGTINVKPHDITGVAPGVLVAGHGDVAVYGPSFEAGTTVELQGPYDLITFPTPHLRCRLVGGCPTTSLAASVNVTGDALLFEVPPGMLDGHYYLKTRKPSGEPSNVTKYLTIRPPTSTRPAVPASDHNVALNLLSGETYTGTFVAGGDPEHVLQDYNMYYFLGTAGSRVSLSLERVDTSKTWEHPDSLDPELLITGPDDFVYQNLVSYDRQPGLDLNAELADAVLPLTGIYFVRAGTSKGAGKYRLHFKVTQLAPPGAGDRIVPLLDNAVTAPVGQDVTPIAIALDPRGHRLAGAFVQYAPAPAAGDTGTLAFTGGAIVTSDTYGGAETRVRLMGQGRIAYTANLVGSFAADLTPAGSANSPSSGVGWGQSSPGSATDGALTSPLRIPRYQPVATQRVAVTEVYADQVLGLALGPPQKLQVEPRLVRRVAANGTEGGRQGASRGAAEPYFGPRPSDVADPLDDPLDASTAVPLPVTDTEAMGVVGDLRMADLRECTPEQFVLGIVPAGTELHPPFSAVLTDLTPATGGTTPQGEVGPEGIHGHRIEKTIQLGLEIRDATGQVPAHPVLVDLNLGGPAHGALLLDGGQTTCNRLTRLWHQRTAEGVLIPDPEISYRLGTRARYVGIVPDQSQPGGVAPVWGVAETIDLGVLAKLPAGQTSDPLLKTYGVHPEPGQPTALACRQHDGQPCGDTFRYWPGYLTAYRLYDAYHVV